MSKVVRSVKNVTKGYSAVQVKVRNATSNDAWGPTGTEMSEIAQITFNGHNDFYEIMDMIDKRLNDKGKNWRHVLKSLKVLDYCLHEGSELVVTWSQKNIYIIKTLREFTYVDDDGRDVGQNVRVSARELTSLIMDEERLKTERSDRRTWKSRVTGIDEYGPPGASNGGESSQGGRRQQERRRNPQRSEEDDLEYKLALEASKNELEEDRKRREGRASSAADDEDLAKAIRLSKEEEELRRRELEESNANSLFDSTFPNPQESQPTGYNQGYQQQGEVDWYGNLKNQQPPQNTGYLNNVYSQGFPNQSTGYQNGFGPQQTGFDPAQQHYLQAQHTLQPQQTAFNTNPYGGQQAGDFNAPQQMNQFGNQAQTPTAGSHNPWGSGATSDALKPMQTGSNNPFASNLQQRQQQPQSTGAPSLNALAEQRTANQFGGNMGFNNGYQQQQQQNSSANVLSLFAPSQNPQSQPQQSSPITQRPQPASSQQHLHPQQTAFPTSQQQQQPKQELDPTRAKLNALLASGEGTDTFGNVGDLRIPAQHTAPGTFVNSAGQNLTRLHTGAQQTGNNPFLSSHHTGLPNSAGAMTGAGNNFSPGGQMYGGGGGNVEGFGGGGSSAGGYGGGRFGGGPGFDVQQTGPAGLQGYGAGNSNNPFGGRPQGAGPGGSLIDI